ncbi:MAG: MaoC family dehydratase N-terminal domain-containing protein [Deltaproteobacteria bacterium]|nr:MaoC family dehydratase N-terminal domain-containing protein [Deltaproteobacteria bacterium]
MELDSCYTGTRLKTYGTSIDARHSMNYAAAVSDVNPVYFDDERAGGILAPPMFSVALTWPILENIGAYILAETFPRELLLTQVHHTEHLSFHRPVLPGEDVTVRGHIAAILPHRAGTRVVICLEAQDANDRPVFTEYLGAMLRGVTCRGGGRGEADLPVTPSAPDAGGAIWETTVFIEPERPHIYDGCTGIVFPIHTSRRFARQVGLPGIILQGTATLAFAAREIVNREAAWDPARLEGLACRFSGMVRPGTTIRIRLVGRSVGEQGNDLFFDVTNEEGQFVLRNGWASVHSSGDADVV